MVKKGIKSVYVVIEWPLKSFPFFTESPHYTKCAAVSPVLEPALTSPNSSSSVPTSPKSSPPAQTLPSNELSTVATTNSTFRYG